MTIGNIPKHIRRKPSRQGQILLAYLPTSKLGHITNKASRRRCLSNLFHYCMKTILKPLEKAGRDGIELVSGDGAVRRCYPILAAYVGDYPEQVLVSIVKSGNCPICPAPRDDIGSWDHILGPRDTDRIITTLNSISQGATEFTKACATEGIKPVQCVFWKDLPYINIYSSIMPDILHQLFQGILKHLIAWIRLACGDAEIDARCRRLPPNHHIRLFMKGICHLSRVTGSEHNQISQFLLALVADIRLPSGHSNGKLIRSVRAVLDFIYLARYPIHTSETVDQMHDALHAFHLNRDIFISLGIREHFNIPKLHNAGHYHQFVQLYGTADNFNTEYTERLHIDLAKDAYASTNFKDEFPQMTSGSIARSVSCTMKNTFIVVWIHPSINHFMSSNLFHPWFHIVTSKWQNTPRIEVYQSRIFVQNTVPQIFFQLFLDSLYNISIQTTLKRRFKLYLNRFMSLF